MAWPGAWAALEAHLDPRSTAALAVAWSGGGDSLALLHLALAYARQTGRRVLALTVDHQLNPDSRAWTEAAGARASALGADWQALAWTDPKPATGLPAAARAARHALLATAARAAGAPVLLMGHTADDLAEARFMQATDTAALSEPRTWSPSPAWPQGRGVFLLRPLLGVRRTALRQTLTELGETWLEDPANEDQTFARARARRALRLSSSEVVPVAAPGLDRAAMVDLATAVSFDPAGYALIDRPTLAAAPDEVALPVLSMVLLCTGGGDRPARGPSLVGLKARLATPGDVTATLAGVRLQAGPRQIILTRETADRRRPRRPGDPDVIDGRFERLAGELDGLLVGRAAQLPRKDRDRLRAILAPARPGLPVVRDAEGRLRLPAPFGEGPGDVRALAGQRFRAACGGVRTEAEIDGVAESGQI